MVIDKTERANPIAAIARQLYNRPILPASLASKRENVIFELALFSQDRGRPVSDAGDLCASPRYLPQQVGPLDAELKDDTENFGLAPFPERLSYPWANYSVRASTQKSLKAPRRAVGIANYRIRFPYAEPEKQTGVPSCLHTRSPRLETVNQIVNGDDYQPGFQSNQGQQPATAPKHGQVIASRQKSHSGHCPETAG
jgi:hypothetical protein